VRPANVQPGDDLENAHEIIIWFFGNSWMNSRI
jgi:hypothetical protein